METYLDSLSTEHVVPNRSLVSFSSLSEDIILNIFTRLEDDPRYLACLACVCSRFSNLIRMTCWKSKCLCMVPILVADLVRPCSQVEVGSVEPPGGWASLQKLVVCCPGLWHAGILLEHWDFGLERELGCSEDYEVNRSRTQYAESSNGNALVEQNIHVENSDWSESSDTGKLIAGVLNSHLANSRRRIAPAMVRQLEGGSDDTGGGIHGFSNTIGDRIFRDKSDEDVHGLERDSLTLNAVVEEVEQSIQVGNSYRSESSDTGKQIAGFLGSHLDNSKRRMVLSMVVQLERGSDDTNGGIPGFCNTAGDRIARDISDKDVHGVEKGSLALNADCNVLKECERFKARSGTLGDDALCNEAQCSSSRGLCRGLPRSIKGKVDMQRVLACGEKPHLAAGSCSLSREQGSKLLKNRFRADSLYVCDSPGCVHLGVKRKYKLFRGVFKDFRNSHVWRNLKDLKAKRTNIACAYCMCESTWDMVTTFCLKRSMEYHEDGEPSVRAYVCENGHVSGAWTDRPFYNS